MKRLAIVAAALCIGAGPPPAERVVEADGVVSARIGDAVLRLRIDPGVPAMPILTEDAATRAGLRAGSFGVSYMVGPERVPGRSAVARMTLSDGTQIRRRVSWAARPFAEGYDGVIGPGTFEDPVVRFVLGPVRPGETVTTLRMAGQRGLAGGWGDRLAEIDVAGQPMRVRFDPHRARTVATAGAAARLALHHGGTLTGAAEAVPISFGITRPVRPMRLARPLAIGALAVAELGVRTSDYGTAGSIPDADVPPDPDEVVVVGERERDLSRDRLTLGADVLGRCSSITFDERAGVIRLSCA